MEPGISKKYTIVFVAKAASYLIQQRSHYRCYSRYCYCLFFFRRCESLCLCYHVLCCLSNCEMLKTYQADCFVQ